MSGPPPFAVSAAIAAARQSPCAKSRRGVAVYRKDAVVGVGFNGQPSGACDEAKFVRTFPSGIVTSGRGILMRAEAKRCREECGKRCVHAEVRAIRAAVANIGHTELEFEYEAVHVKVDHDLVPGGGPSCWQCSREVLDVGLAGFWLFEVDPLSPECPGPKCPLCAGEDCSLCHPGPGRPHCDHDVVDRHAAYPNAVMPRLGVWKRYTSEEFHAATLKACNLV